jgi:hypothetical protein
MAQDDVLTDPDEVLDDDVEDDFDEDADLDEDGVSEVDDIVDDDVIDDVDDDDTEIETETEALEELEAEELELLDDEVAEALLVDEVAELRAIRREELTMNIDAQQAQVDEFVCSSCFLVKRTSQLANRRKMICSDCAS